MCLDCKIPGGADLLELDSWELAFLTLTGHVEWRDSFDMAFMLMKANGGHASSQYLWGPEADLLSATITGAWKKVGVDHCKRLQNAFDLSGDVSVDPEALKAAMKESAKAGKEMWLACGAKVRTIMEVTVEKGRKHFEQQKHQTRKANWGEYVSSAMSDHVQAYIERYPDRMLHPVVENLARIAQESPRTRLIDKAQLKERIERLHDRGESYFANLSDVQAGRAWTFTGIQMAHEQRVTEYMVVAENDSRTCPTCQRLDGRHFPVEGAHSRMERALASTDPEEIAGIWPFPRVRDIDNRSPDYIRSLHFAPPFHSRCRCDVQFLWGEVAIEQVVDADPVMYGKLVSDQPLGGGANETRVVTFRGQSGEEVTGVFKPIKGEAWGYPATVQNQTFRFAHREVAAHEIDKVLGLELSPRTVLKTINGEVGSFQYFVQNAKLDAMWTARKLTEAERYKIGVYDYLCGQADRHRKNFMRVASKEQFGRPWLIDNGGAFPAQTKGFKNGCEEFRCQPVNSNWLPKAGKLDDAIALAEKQRLTKALKEWDVDEFITRWQLSESEAAALKYRYDDLIKRIETNKVDDLFRGYSSGSRRLAPAAIGDDVPAPTFFVDDAGKPSSFFHGTDKRFDKFDLGRLRTGADVGGASWYGDGVYLSGEPWKGRSYAYATEKAGNVAVVEAAVKNPFLVRGTGAADWYESLNNAGLGFLKDKTSAEITAELKKRGFDSIAVLKNDSRIVNELIVFRAKDAKIVKWVERSEFNVKDFKAVELGKPVAKPTPKPTPKPKISKYTLRDDSDEFFDESEKAAKKIHDSIIGDSLKQRSAMSEAGDKAIDTYSRQHFKKMNAYLRFGDDLDDELKKAVVDLDKALKQAKTPMDMTTYRTVRGDKFSTPFLKGEIGIGDTFTDNGFVSTRIDEYMPNAITVKGKGDVHMLRIHVPKGSNGLYLTTGKDVTSAYEKELLLNAGTKFKVIGISQADNGALVLDVAVI